MHIEKCKTLSDSALTPHKLKVRSYQSSYFGIKQSRSEAKQSKVKQKLSKSEAKHRFEQKLLDLGCSCSPHVFDLSIFQIWTSFFFSSAKFDIVRKLCQAESEK